MLPTKPPRPAEVLAEGESGLEWIVAEGADQFWPRPAAEARDQVEVHPNTLLLLFSQEEISDCNLEELLP